MYFYWQYIAKSTQHKIECWVNIYFWIGVLQRANMGVIQVKKKELRVLQTQ